MVSHTHTHKSQLQLIRQRVNLIDVCVGNYVPNGNNISWWGGRSILQVEVFRTENDEGSTHWRTGQTGLFFAGLTEILQALGHHYFDASISNTHVWSERERERERERDV